MDGSGLRDVSYPHVTVLLSAAEWVEEVMGSGSSTGSARGGPMGHGGSSSGGMGGGSSGAGSGGGLRRLVGRVAHAHPDCSFSVLVVGLEKHLVTLERKGPVGVVSQCVAVTECQTHEGMQGSKVDEGESWLGGQTCWLELRPGALLRVSFCIVWCLVLCTF